MTREQTIGNAAAPDTAGTAPAAGCAEAEGELRDLQAQLAKEREARRGLERRLIGMQASQAELARIAREQERAAPRELREYARELEKRHAAMLASETWRAMEPVRRAVRLLRGRKPTPPFVPRLSGNGGKAARPGTPRGRAGTAEVARYFHHLWGGLSQPAVRELSRVLEDEGYEPADRFDAASFLATWHAFAGDLDAALAAIRAIERVAPERRDAKERWIKEGFIRLARGERAVARAAFAAFLATPEGRDDPDATLALANLLDDDDLRLAEINKVFERAGFVPIERIDRARPLAFGNIRGREVAARIGGLGRVSVIVPAFNAKGCIGPALRSLRAQSYGDIEILVVDDASTDGTAAVVAEAAREDPRIRLIRQERNGGAYAARNRGLAEATGVFITTHDTDDWSHPQKLETQLAFLAAEPQVEGVCTFWVRVQPSLEFTPNWRLRERLLHWNHSSFLFRRAVLDELGAWDPVRVGADTELIWRIQAERGKPAVQKIADDVPLSFALDDEGSLTRSRETHVRSVYFGLRHIYRAAARYSHAHAPDPALAADLRLRASPAALTGGAPTIALDFLLLGDCTRPPVVEEMRAFIDGEGRGQRIGLFHWPDFTARPADLCAGYCALITRDEVEPIPPGARVVLPRRYGIFFGRNHLEIDQFPAIFATPRDSS